MKHSDFLLGLCLAMLALLGACQKPVPAAPSRPHILFAIADDASYPHMSAYGCTWVQTPGFDRVAREGLLFTRAYTPNAKCSPSRACILTGRNSWQLEAAANHVPFFPPKFRTYAESLGERGYFVGHVAKGWAPGVALDSAGKARELLGPAYNQHELDPPARHISRNDYTKNFAAFLDARPEGKPFCFWYGSTEPHRRYEYGVGIRQGGKQLSEIDSVFSFWPDHDSIRTDLLDYAYEIEYFDQHLRNMLAELEQRGLLANTLVVVTADNGMPFPRIKGQKYELSHHLPLAMMWPTGIQQAGRTVKDFVSFIDFAPTFLELAGISPQSSGMQAITGHSFSDLLYAQPSSLPRDHVLIGKERHDVGRPQDQGYPIRGIVTQDYLYLHNYHPERWPVGNPETGYLNTDGSPTKSLMLDAHRRDPQSPYWALNFGKRPAEELYQISVDPACMHNLATSAAHQATKTRLRTEMEAKLKAEGDPRALGEGEVFMTYPYAHESGRGFYERYMAGEQMQAGWVNEGDFEKKDR